MTTPRWIDFLQIFHLKQGLGHNHPPQTRHFRLSTHLPRFARREAGAISLHWITGQTILTIRISNGFTKVDKKCNGKNLNWFNTKTSDYPNLTVIIMDSQQLHMSWTTFIERHCLEVSSAFSGLWCETGQFGHIHTVQYYSHLSILPKPAPLPAIS